ncbi:MAG: FtsX-like permease family protein [Planctomycetota bacterium]
MATPLAWKNLKHNWVRTAVGMAGVGFAAMLIFMQMGFKGAIERTATQIYDAIDFDLMLRSPAYLHLTEPRSFPRQRLLQAAAVPGVASARPLHVGLTEWQTPPRQGDSAPATGAEQAAGVGIGRGILILGVEPDDAPFAAHRQDLRDAARRLTSPRFLLMDTKTKPEYGPQAGNRFGPADVGVRTGLGPNRVQIVGLFELGSGMVCNGACMTNVEGFYDASPLETRGQVNLGLIKLQDPAAAPSVAEALRQALGAGAGDLADVEVLTRAEVTAQERRRWMVETPFGAIFQLGVVVAVFVGVAIVYQVLSNDIANMMSEYATLKAIGYSNDYLTGVVMKQSVLLAVVSFVPSLATAWALYRLIAQSAGIPMDLTLTIVVSVLLLTVLMCLASGLAALRKLFSADPASLF